VLIIALQVIQPHNQHYHRLVPLYQQFYMDKVMNYKVRYIVQHFTLHYKKMIIYRWTFYQSVENTGSKSAMNLQEIQHTDFADLLVVDHDKKYKDDD
jgi:hypothetical protein